MKGASKQRTLFIAGVETPTSIALFVDQDPRYYTHDAPDVEQQFMPDELRDKKYL